MTLTARGRRVLWTAAFAFTFLAGMAVQTEPRVPLCQEDEVILASGECWPLDDADYTPEGWRRAVLDRAEVVPASGIQT